MLSGDALIGLPWLSISAFIRVLSNARLPGERFTIKELVEIVERWIEQPNVRLLSPGERHWTVFREMLLNGQVRGPMTTDAQLAGLTIESGGVLYTTDRDFTRFLDCAGTTQSPDRLCYHPLRNILRKKLHAMSIPVSAGRRVDRDGITNPADKSQGACNEISMYL